MTTRNSDMKGGKTKKFMFGKLSNGGGSGRGLGHDIMGFHNMSQSEVHRVDTSHDYYGKEEDDDEEFDVIKRGSMLDG
jgi:hypothetical protein